MERAENGRPPQLGLRRSATMLAALVMMCITAGADGAIAVPSVGPIASLANPSFLSNTTLAVAVDLTSASQIDRSFVVAVAFDQFRRDAPDQFKTSSLVIRPAETRTYARPFGLAALLARVQSTADTGSLQFNSHVTVLNGSFAVITFASVPGFDGLDGDVALLYVDGGLMLSGRTLGPLAVTFLGPGRSQDVAWAVVIVVITMATILADPHGVVDCHLMIVLVSMPYAHSVIARIGAVLMRLVAPFGFGEPLTPHAILGSVWVITAVLLLLVAVGFLHGGSFEAAPGLLSRWWYSGLCVLLVPGMLSTWLCMTRNESGGLVFFGVLGFLVTYVIPSALVVAWVHRHRHLGRFFPYSWFDRQRWWMRVVLPPGYWSDDVAATNWTGIRELDPTSKSAGLFFPLAKAMPACIILGSSPNNPADCAAVYSLAATHFAFCIIFDAVARRRRVLVISLLDGLVDFGLLLVAAGGATNAQGDARAMPIAMYFGVGFVVIGTAFRTGALAALIFLEPDWVRDDRLHGEDRARAAAQEAPKLL